MDTDQRTPEAPPWVAAVDRELDAMIERARVLERKVRALTKVVREAT